MLNKHFVTSSSVKAAADLLGISSEEATLLFQHKENFHSFLQQSGFESFLEDLTASIELNKFITAISDDKAIRVLVDARGWIRSRAESVVKGWRTYAAKQNYNGPVAWLVLPGFTLRGHARRLGPCLQDFDYVLIRDMGESAPTVHSLVFWIPCSAPQGSNLTVAEAMQLRKVLLKEYGITESRKGGFGSHTLLYGLLLTSLRRTGSLVLSGRERVLTDTEMMVGAHKGKLTTIGILGGQLVSHVCTNPRQRDKNRSFFLLQMEALP